MVDTAQHMFKDVMQSIFAGGSVHKPDRGNPLMVQLMVGEGMPSAWQSNLTVSPGAYNWLTGLLVQKGAAAKDKRSIRSRTGVALCNISFNFLHGQRC